MDRKNIHQLAGEIQEKLSPVKLYLDDLKALTELCSDLPDHSISFSSKTINSATIDELENLPKKDVEGLVMKVASNTSLDSLTIDFSSFRDGPWIHAFCANEEHRGAYRSLSLQFREYLASKKRFGNWTDHLSDVAFLLVILGPIAVFFIDFRKHDNNIYLVHSAILFVMIVLLFLSSKITKNSRITKILPYIKANEKTFWEQKKYDLVTNIISAIVGAIVGVIGTLIIQKIF